MSMEKVRQVMQSIGALPKLRLGEKTAKGVVSFGPKHVKFLAEPTGVTKKDYQGKEQKMLRFEVEHNGNKYHWFVRVLNREGEPNYLLEKLADVQVGDERVLEMLKQGARNYIDVRNVGAAPAEPTEEDADPDEGIFPEYHEQ